MSMSNWKRNPSQQFAITTTNSEINDNVIPWIIDQANQIAPPVYLLAYAVDGVIWGRFDGGNLTIAKETIDDITLLNISPALDADTLQQGYVFGQDGEAHFWKQGKNWRARTLTETNSNNADLVLDAFDEPQILWGDSSIHVENTDFTIMEEGAQGLHHILPESIQLPTEQTRAVLMIRHYLAVNTDGITRIKDHRLVSIEVKNYAE